MCPEHSCLPRSQQAGQGIRGQAGQWGGVGVGSSRQGCGRPHGSEEPDEREGGAPAPHLPLSVLTPLPLWRPCAPSVQICGPEWGQQRVSTARLQTRARDPAGPSGGRGRGLGQATSGGAGGGGARSLPAPPTHTSPVPVSSLTLPEIPSITHRQAKSGVLSSSLRSCLRS